MARIRLLCSHCADQLSSCAEYKNGTGFYPIPTVYSNKTTASSTMLTKREKAISTINENKEGKKKKKNMDLQMAGRCRQYGVCSAAKFSCTNTTLLVILKQARYSWLLSFDKKLENGTAQMKMK